MPDVQRIEEIEHDNAAQFIRDRVLCWMQTWGVGVGQHALDLGCGKWKLQDWMTGVDISGVADIQDDIQVLGKFRDSTQDFVFSSHALEHLPEPVTALFHFHRVLKTGKRLFLYLPHHDYVPWRKANMPPHLHDLNFRQVAKWMEILGFDDIFGDTGPDQWMGWWISGEAAEVKYEEKG